MIILIAIMKLPHLIRILIKLFNDTIYKCFTITCKVVPVRNHVSNQVQNIYS